MTPGQILTIVKDVAIIAGLIFVILWIRNDGKNVVKLQDLQAVQQQIASNAAQEAAWQSQRQEAEAQRVQDTQTITAAIGAHRDPLIVRVPASANTVPGVAPKTASICPASGGDDAGSRVDLRPAVAAFELKYETVLADCRSALSQWP